MLSTTPLPYIWSWQGQQVKIAFSCGGTGQSVLLLPAFSTVSTRQEAAVVATSLASEFRVTTVDLPGFGDSDRPPLAYTPDLYQQFLADFIRDVVPQPTAVVAAGHTAGYVMKLAQQQPQLFTQIALVAPTWRGPLPSMMKGQKPWFKLLENLVRSPILGQALYQVNTSPGFLRLMFQRHVYATPSSITADLIDRKRQITQHPGARFAPAAFVTGGLDPVESREAFQAFFAELAIPVFLIIGADSPPNSKAEMESMSQIPGVMAVTLPGTLGLLEEYAPQVTAALRSVLKS